MGVSFKADSTNGRTTPTTNGNAVAVKPQPKPQQQIHQPKPHPQPKHKPDPGYTGKPTVRVTLTPLAIARCSATEFLAWVRQQNGEV